MPAGDPSDGAGDNGGIGGPSGAPDDAGGGYDNPGLGVTGTGTSDRGIGTNPGFDQASAAAAAMGMGLGDAIGGLGGSGMSNTLASMAVPAPMSILNGIVTALGLQAPNHISPGQFMGSMFNNLGSLPGVLSAAFSGFPGNVTHSTDMTPTNAPGGVGGNPIAQALANIIQQNQQQQQNPFGNPYMNPYFQQQQMMNPWQQFSPYQQQPSFNPYNPYNSPMAPFGMQQQMPPWMQMQQMGHYGMGGPFGQPQQQQNIRDMPPLMDPRYAERMPWSPRVQPWDTGGQQQQVQSFQQMPMNTQGGGRSIFGESPVGNAYNLPFPQRQQQQQMTPIGDPYEAFGMVRQQRPQLPMINFAPRGPSRQMSAPRPTCLLYTSPSPRDS